MHPTPEENLAYEIARQWRDENYRPDLKGIDWQKFAHLLTHNRMSVLAMPIVERTGATIPIAIPEQAEKYQRAAKKLGDALVTYLHAAKSCGLETIVLKGLWLCNKVYRNISMRPGGDIDLLVPRAQVDSSLALLKEQGIGEFWPNLLHDDYFTRHHLHQQRCTPDLNIWFEIHWALDHPYTLLTIDYGGIFERAKPSTLLGAPIWEMSLPDLLLSLSVHIVKHAVYLPSLIERDDLARIILADGMLMYYLDVSEIIRQHQEIDWDLTIRLARDWGAVDILGSVLRVCQRQFDAPIPDEILSALRVSRPWPAARSLMGRVADQELAAYEGRAGSRFWKLLLASNGAFILRPVRIFESASYFLQPADFLTRRYRSSRLLTRLRHFFIALWQTIRFGWDTVYFGIERYFRLKRMGKSASLFNRLEIDL
jgi:hypothetical protein